MKRLAIFVLCMLIPMALSGQTKSDSTAVLSGIEFTIVDNDTQLTVIQGDTVELRVIEVTTLNDGDPLPPTDIFLYHIRALYEDGATEDLKQNDPLSFVEGAKIVVEADLTAKVGLHTIRAWVTRLKPSGAAGENNIPSVFTVLKLKVDPRIDNRPPARLIITIHPKS